MVQVLPVPALASIRLRPSACKGKTRQSVGAAVFAETVVLID